MGKFYKFYSKYKIEIFQSTRETLFKNNFKKDISLITYKRYIIVVYNDDRYT